MATLTKFGPKEILLSADSRLVFDYQDGLYRLAYYVRVRNKEGDWVNRRFTAKKPKLLDGIRLCFSLADAIHDADLTEEYIRSTEWGRTLPR